MKCRDGFWIAGRVVAVGKVGNGMGVVSMHGMDGSARARCLSCVEAAMVTIFQRNL